MNAHAPLPAPAPTPPLGLPRDHGLDMPPPALRTALNGLAARFRAEHRTMQALALADALEGMGSGEDRAACQAIREAAVYRRAGL